jgi:hypothetical protein
LSVAAKVVMGTVRLVAVAGMLKAVTVGAVVSRVMVTEALRLAETLPAASLAQAYSVFAPALAKVYEVGGAEDHPVAVAGGEVLDSVAT